MSEPFLGEIRIVSFGYAPKGWALCDGQFLPINQNQALFSLLGTMYGGNGQTTFALPDLQARVPLHMGNGHTQGEGGGESAHALSTTELPMHTHLLQASTTDGDSPVPTNNILAGSPVQLYAPPNSLVDLNPGTVTNVGLSQPHVNMQPFLTLSFCIALQGIFPSRN